MIIVNKPKFYHFIMFSPPTFDIDLKLQKNDFYGPKDDTQG